MLLMRVESHRGISYLTVSHSRDSLTDWRVGPDHTLPDGTDKYHDREYGAKL